MPKQPWPIVHPRIELVTKLIAVMDEADNSRAFTPEEIVISFTAGLAATIEAHMNKRTDMHVQVDTMADAMHKMIDQILDSRSRNRD